MVRLQQSCARTLSHMNQTRLQHCLARQSHWIHNHKLQGRGNP